MQWKNSVTQDPVGGKTTRARMMRELNNMISEENLKELGYLI